MREHKFKRDLVQGVVHRCHWGFPQVILCRPLHRLAPFPTSFWLTCPLLVQRMSRAEAEHGVPELEVWLNNNAMQEWIAFNIKHQRLRLSLMSEGQRVFLSRFKPYLYERLRTTGVGGIIQTNRANVKCLHLQTAALLALGSHPASEWLLAHGAGDFCLENVKLCQLTDSSI